jgi:hypothetical protein
MAKQNQTTLKGYFETGDVPNQSQYGHLIESQLNLAETGTIIAAGTISASGFISENHITSSGNISSSGNVYIGGFISASGNISSSGIIKGLTGSFGRLEGLSPITVGDIVNFNENVIFGSDISVTGTTTFASSTATNISATGNITCSGILQTLSHITASGNISSSGTVIASDYTLDGVALTTTFAELNYLDGLTSGEATQIKAIDTKTISNTQWGYVGNMNQNVTISSQVQFAGITLTKTSTYNGNYGQIINTEGQSFKLTLANVPFIPGRASGIIAKSAPTIITSPQTTEASVILATVASAELSVTAFKVANGSFAISLGNEAAGDFGGGTVSINFTIF